MSVKWIEEFFGRKFGIVFTFCTIHSEVDFDVKVCVPTCDGLWNTICHHSEKNLNLAFLSIHYHFIEFARK